MSTSNLIRIFYYEKKKRVNGAQNEAYVANICAEMYVTKLSTSSSRKRESNIKRGKLRRSEQKETKKCLDQFLLNYQTEKM